MENDVDTIKLVFELGVDPAILDGAYGERHRFAGQCTTNGEERLTSGLPTIHPEYRLTSE